MSIYGNPVMLGGSGGGSTNILSGTTEPTSAQGSNGSVYLRYAQREYTPLDYIESSGNQYIDTGIIGGDDLDIECDIVFPSSLSSSWRWLLGAMKSNVTRSYGIGLNGLSLLTFQRGTNIFDDESYSFSLGNHYVFKTVGTSLYINGVLISTVGDDSFETPGNIYFMRNNGSSDLWLTARSYYLKMSKNGTLVRYLVPAMGESNEPGMLDLVTGKYYYSASSTPFSYGSIQTAVTDYPVIGGRVKVDGTWQDLIGTDINDINLGS